MKPAPTVLLLMVLVSASAYAAPGDPRLRQGTLVWPPTLSDQQVIILRGDDGRTFYADIAAARRRTTGPIAAGTRMTVLGVEGAHAQLVTATLLASGDAATLAFSLFHDRRPGPPTSPRPGEPSTVPGAGTPTPGWVEIRGVVQSVEDRMFTLRTDTGAIVTVDALAVRSHPPAIVAPGATVSVVGVPVEFEAISVIDADRRQ